VLLVYLWIVVPFVQRSRGETESLDDNPDD